MLTPIILPLGELILKMAKQVEEHPYISNGEKEAWLDLVKKVTEIPGDKFDDKERFDAWAESKERSGPETEEGDIPGQDDDE